MLSTLSKKTCIMTWNQIASTAKATTTKHSKQTSVSLGKLLEDARERRPLLPVPPREGVDKPNHGLGDHRTLARTQPPLTPSILRTAFRGGLWFDVLVRALREMEKDHEIDIDIDIDNQR